jgi:hypothetical protein
MKEHTGDTGSVESIVSLVSVKVWYTTVQSYKGTRPGYCTTVPNTPPETPPRPSTDTVQYRSTVSVRASRSRVSRTQFATGSLKTCLITVLP